MDFFFFKNNNSLIGKIYFLEEEMEIIKNKSFEENNDKYLWENEKDIKLIEGSTHIPTY